MSAIATDQITLTLDQAEVQELLLLLGDLNDGQAIGPAGRRIAGELRLTLGRSIGRALTAPRVAGARVNVEAAFLGLDGLADHDTLATVVAARDAIARFEASRVAGWRVHPFTPAPFPDGQQCELCTHEADRPWHTSAR
jgi:hypothetical protein